MRHKVTSHADIPAYGVLKSRPVDFGAQLAAIRKARHLSQEKLARRAGVSRGTIQNAESSTTCQLNESTVLGLYKALASLSPPLTESETAFFVEHGRIDPRMAESIRPAPVGAGQPQPLEVRRLHRLLDLIIQAIGTKPVAAALTALVAAFRIDEPDAHHGVTVKHPPVQREGFVEQVEVDYTVAEERAAARAKPRRAAR